MGSGIASDRDPRVRVRQRVDAIQGDARPLGISLRLVRRLRKSATTIEKAAATLSGGNGFAAGRGDRQVDTRSPFLRGLIGPVRTQLRPASLAASSACSASCTIVSTLSWP
jgi:hypothetical protein